MLAAAKRALSVGLAEADGAEDGGLHRLRPGRIGRAFQATLDVIDLLSRVILIGMFCGELGLILIEICRRELFDQSFLWLEEVSRIVLLTIAFIGGPLAYREKSHAAVSFITRSFRPARRAAIEAGIDVVIMGIGVLTAAVSVDLVEVDSMSILPMTQWNLAVTAVPFLIGMSFIVLFALERRFCSTGGQRCCARFWAWAR